MDSFDRRILATLKNGESFEFKQLLAEVGFSHNTLRLHVAKLKLQGIIVVAEKTMNCPGRPILTYSLPPEIKQKVALTLTDPYTAIVSLTFQKLKPFAGLRKADTAKKLDETAELKTAPKS